MPLSTWAKRCPFFHLGQTVPLLSLGQTVPLFPLGPRGAPLFPWAKRRLFCTWAKKCPFSLGPNGAPFSLGPNGAHGTFTGGGLCCRKRLQSQIATLPASLQLCSQNSIFFLLHTRSPKEECQPSAAFGTLGL